MRIRPDVEDIQTTRTEKLLAGVLAAFVLLGGIWTYQRLDDVVRNHVHVPTVATAGPASERLSLATAHEQVAQRRRAKALQDLELKREAYRTALDAKEPAARLKAQYVAAQRELAAATRAVAAAGAQAASLRPAAAREQQRLQDRVESALDRQERDAFFARLALSLAYIAGSLGLLVWMRRRTSRRIPLAGGVVIATTILVFVMAADYLTDYVDPFDWGIAAIAGFGIVATLLVYWGVERYLIRRIPQRRVKRRQCPFCGYPVGDGPHCEGCGREVAAPCTKCEAPRRVGTAYCATCGSTGG
jgi:hypothetical protein